jgi:histidinol-phosphate phosphatase family protein
MKRKEFLGVVFLDRDGVINVDRRDYVKSWSEFKFLPGVFEALRLLKKNDVRVIVVTNQSAVNRGLMTLNTLQDIHEKMLGAIRTHGGDIQAIYYCPHTPAENCECRKPKSGMVKNAIKDLKIDLSVSYLVGDSEKDIELGRSVKVKSVKIVEKTASRLLPHRPEWTYKKPVLAPSLREAVALILYDVKNSARS